MGNGRIEVTIISAIRDNRYFRRDFLGLAGKLGAGILAAGLGLTALDGLVGNEENVVYAQGKKAKLKWKDYRDPEKATITYDPETDRTLSKEFIEWDMKGFWYPKKCPILEEEPDIPQKILEIGEELKVDPCVIMSTFKIASQYGKLSTICTITKAPWGIPASKDYPEEKKYNDLEKNRVLIKFDKWSEGIKAGFEPSAKYEKLAEANKYQDTKLICTTITQMQYLDEYLDRKTREKTDPETKEKVKVYDVRSWKSMWDAVKKKIK